jgi:ATP-dependent DNA ligase
MATVRSSSSKLARLAVIIVSKRLGSPYRSGRVNDWLKIKNLAAPAVQREAEEDWGRKSRRRITGSTFAAY